MTDFKSMATLDDYLDEDKQKQAEANYQEKMKLFKAKKATENIRSVERKTVLNGLQTDE